MQVLNKLQIKNIEVKKNKTFKVLILDCKNNKKILGLTQSEWIKFSCLDIPSEIINFHENTNILEFVEPYLDDLFDYSIVLLSKTPLITNETLQNMFFEKYQENIEQFQNPQLMAIEISVLLWITGGILAALYYPIIKRIFNMGVPKNLKTHIDF